jgi:uncharacterized membrane protein YhhN
MSALILLCIFSAACVLGLLWSEVSHRTHFSWLFKPAAAGCFIALACFQGATDSLYGQLLLLGLCLCFAGDVLLIPEKNELSFKAGLASFLLGHLAYAIAFSQLELTQSGFWYALGPALGLSFFAWRWLRPHLQQDMVIPVLAYFAVITAMLLVASSTAGISGGQWIVAGAWGFALSDLAVARNQFIIAQARNRLWGTPLYFASQMLLAYTPALI